MQFYHHAASFSVNKYLDGMVATVLKSHSVGGTKRVARVHHLIRMLISFLNNINP
jgi:hypothetical protein